MYAVFHKGQFVNWWLNQPGDHGWIERTIASLGWRPEDVKVVWFNTRPGADLIYSFDDQARLLIHEEVVQDVLMPKENEDDPDVFSSMKVTRVQSVSSGRVDFENGINLYQQNQIG